MARRGQRAQNRPKGVYARLRRAMGALRTQSALQWAILHTLHSPSDAVRLRPLPRFLEIAQVRRRLALAARHQAAVGAEEIGFAADEEVLAVGVLAGVLEPGRLALAPIAAGHGPGPRQSVVDGGDLVAQDVRIVAVEMDEFGDDG